MVLPSVPVMPTMPSSRLGSPYHHAAAAASAARARRRRSAAPATPPIRPLDDHRHRAEGRCGGDVVVAVDVLAGHGHEDGARCDTAGSRRRCHDGHRTDGDGARPWVERPGIPGPDRGVGIRRRPDRPAAGPSASSRSISSPRRRGSLGSAAASIAVAHVRPGRARPAPAPRRRGSRPALRGVRPIATLGVRPRRRTLRMPWRSSPIRSCIDCAPSNARRPAGSSTRSQAPTYLISRPPKPVLKCSMPSWEMPHMS